MKIAFRISKMGYGGAERVFLSVARYLMQVHNVQVHFVVDKVGVGETECIVEKNGFYLFSLECNRTLQSIMPLKKYLNLHKPDILVSAYTDTNFGAIISSKLSTSQCKVIVSEHASLDEHWQSAGYLRRLMLNLYVSYGYRLSSHVLTVSKGIASQIVHRGIADDKVECIYNPVRFDNKTTRNLLKKEKKDVPVVLSVGRISKQKDYLTLLRAFKIVLQSTIARLIVVGGQYDAAEKSKLDKYIQANNLADHVTFVGFSQNVDEYYSLANVFVLSSAWEGFGNVIVEALAFGLPIVSTNCNYGPAEILEDKYGLLVSVGDSHAMATAIEDVLRQNPFPLEEQTRRAEDFSELKIGEAYYQLFRKVLKQE